MKQPVVILLWFALFACGPAAPAKPPATPAGTDTAAAATGAGAERGESAPSETPPSGEGSDEEVKEFQIRDSDTASEARGAAPSKIKPTKTEAALRLFVVHKDKGPIPGVVIKLTDPTGKSYYTEETDAKGYAEVLVPVGKTYQMTYLTLGRRDVRAKVTVSDKPNQNIRLTLRYNREDYDGTDSDLDVRRVVLRGVTFESGKATLRPESYDKLDVVVEYMTHKKSLRIEIAGHTDNVGNPRKNKELSKRRADACRDYLVKQGIDPSRIKTVGYGDERPVAPNDTEEGRQKNRRIEVTEL